jgi:hypothetical protein
LLQAPRALEVKDRVEFGRTPIPLGQGRIARTVQASHDEPSPGIYGSDTPYPATRAELVSVQRLCGYDIALIRLFPAQYLPAKGLLLHSRRLRLELELTAEAGGQSSRLPPHRAAARAARISDLVDNPGQIAAYDEMAREAAAAATRRGSPGLQQSGTYDYLLITSGALLPAFQPLVGLKQAEGLSVKTETVEQIYATYAGRDNPEKIRNYIKQAYTAWGVQYVLLGGDASVVPPRGAYAWMERRITDLPTDLYYACLDGTWNGDGDDVWGEPDDGDGGGDVDLLGEVYVGRAPVETPEEATTFVNKVISYEQKGTPHTDRALLLGEVLGYSEVPEQGGDALDTLLPHLSAYSIEWLDDRPEETPQWTGADCAMKLNGSPHIVAHFGHGDEEHVLRLDRAAVRALTNEHLFLVNSPACRSGNFPYADCIGEEFSKGTSHGAFAVIMNTDNGWYDHDATWRFSGEFQQTFFNRLLTQGVTNVGRALQLSKHDMVGSVEMTGPMPYRWCYYEITLLGDPHTALKTFPTTRLTVKSFDETSGVNAYFTGVPVGVDPAPAGVTEFSRLYAVDAQVGLTASESHENVRFQRWRLDGVEQPERQQQLTVTMGADHEAVAVYQDAPVLSLDETQSSQHVRPGETVSVRVNLANLKDRGVNSVQALFEYDDSRLDNPSVVKSAAPPWDAGEETGPTYDGSKIDYAIGLAGSTSAEADVAVLTFTAGKTEGTAYVRFRPDQPGEGKFTKLLEAPGGTDLWPAKRDAGPIVIDGTDPVVEVWCPNGGEALLGGETFDIWWMWDEANLATTTLQYSADAGATWTTIETFPADSEYAQDALYPWEVPVISSDRCLVKVIATDKAGNVGEDVSDDFFSISSPVLTVRSYDASSFVSDYFTGLPIVVDPAPVGITQFSRAYVTGSAVTLTAPGVHGGQSFSHWKLDDVDQEPGIAELSVTMDGDHTTVAVYHRDRLCIDVQVFQHGSSLLNPTGPAPRTLGILRIDVPGNPESDQVAITIGGGSWLRFVTDAGGNVDAFADGAAPDWHTAAQWAGKRIRGLTPGTTYNFQAKSRAGPGTPETELIDVGSYSTNADRDVDRGGVVTEADLIFVRDAVLSGAEVGQAGKAWATDINDTRTTTVLDLILIRNRILGLD